MKKIFAELLSIALTFPAVNKLHSYVKENKNTIIMTLKSIGLIIGILFYVVLFIMLAIEEHKKEQSKATINQEQNK